MRQTLVPVLLLAAVALSSSNVLPMSNSRLETANNGQQNDNIFRSRYNNRNTYNTLFYTVPVGTSRSSRPLERFAKYINTNNNREMESLNGVVSDDDNYDGEGFRKEQWHNYPRQLDRLHLLEYHKSDTKRSTDTDDPGTKEYDSADSKERIIGDVPTDDLQDSSEDIRNLYDTVIAATNPFLVLKIHLSCLKTGLKYALTTQPELDTFQTELKNEIESNDDMEKLLINEINHLNKVKREGVFPRKSQNSGEESSAGKKTVNKRLFSLWSRLQSLSHKGHELPHRRHLAYYGFPSEVDSPNPEHSRRATLMRPPGSPLRWG